MTDIDTILAQHRLATPPGPLRQRVIAAVAERRRRNKQETVLRWAITALVAVFAWAHVQETATAERMARATAAASGITLQQEPNAHGLVARALLYPRIPMPLPMGCASTRRHVTLLSVEVGEWTP